MTQSVISLPFSFNADGGVSHTEDERKIWQERVLLTVMTSVGERLMRLDYGTLVNSASFQSVDDATNLIKGEIGTAFTRWLTSLTLQDIIVSADPVDDVLSFNIIYTYGVAVKITESVVVKTAIFDKTGTIITEVNNG
jgi:phage baseplate assembly protein W